MPIGLGIGIGISIGGGSGGGVSPPRIQLSGLSIAEDAVGDTEIGTASVANAPEGVTYTWAITSDPDSKFAIDETTGVLTLATLATLDYETATSHQVTIEATPSAGDPPPPREFTISVTNVLEVTLNALSLDADELTENSAEDTAVGAVQDKTSGSTLTLIDTAGGRFKLSGTNIVAGATPSDYEVATSYEITLRETHPDASNSPRDTVIEVTILDDPDDTDTVPDAFEAGDWSIAAGDEEADVTISSLPADGGDTITDVEYRLDGGSWVSSGGTSSFTISGLTNDQEYDVELRAVNSVGAGAASDTKQVTPEGSASYVGPGDIVSGATAWFGLRAYSNATIGANAIRIRRVSDNAEQNFVTLADGSLDVASIATFIAATTGRVVTLYDQTGNGRHVTQATAGNQPQIILSGLGSLPVLRFTRSSTHRLIGSSTYGATAAQPVTWSLVAKRTGNTSSFQVAAGAGTTNSMAIGFPNSANQVGGFAGSWQGASAADNSFHAVQMVYNGASSTIAVDGSESTVSAGTNGLSSSHTLRVGDDSFGSILDGDFVEAGVWQSGFNGTQRSNMNSNQHSYWGF
jgi:hypothetical protein